MSYLLKERVFVFENRKRTAKSFHNSSLVHIANLVAIWSVAVLSNWGYIPISDQVVILLRYIT